MGGRHIIATTFVCVGDFDFDLDRQAFRLPLPVTCLFRLTRWRGYAVVFGKEVLALINPAFGFTFAAGQRIPWHADHVNSQRQSISKAFLHVSDAVLGR